MKLEQLHIVYFLGIGGIGMSALARWFRHQGLMVSGYDRTPTELTDELEREGISVHFEDDIKHLPEALFQHKNNSLVIYTPAIHKGHNEYTYLLEQGFTIKKRSAVLGMITESMYSVAVAGTHGKTTTSSIVAHLLKVGGKNCAAFLGGISQNYNSNLLLHEKNGEENIAVVEADEFDRSFLALHPNISVITSADADHLDIYGEKKELTKSFKDFAHKTNGKGLLIIQSKIYAEICPEKPEFETMTYGLEAGDVKAEDIYIKDAAFYFNVRLKERLITGFILKVPGFHNVENTLAAIAVADYLGVSEEKMREAIASYKGVKRRFEYIIQQDNITFIDDYAHHPVEIEAFVKSVKAVYPNRKLTVVFQPHLYSRTRDFAAEFAQSLSLADKVILLEIYPARELPMEGVSSRIIFDGIHAAEKLMCTKEELLQKLTEMQVDVLATVGAGDIDKLVKPICKILNKRYATA